MVSDWRPHRENESSVSLEKIWCKACPEQYQSIFDGLTIEEKFTVFCVGHEYLQELKMQLNKRLLKISLKINQEKQVQKKRQAFFEDRLHKEIDKYLFVDPYKKHLPENVLKAMRILSKELFIASGKTEEEYLDYLEYLSSLE